MKKSNLESFEREKKWLLEEKYGVDSESELEGRKIKDFSSDLKRLGSGEPLAFVIGFQPFLNCKIDLEFKPLIPRSETEFWVNDFIKNYLKKKEQNYSKNALKKGTQSIGENQKNNLDQPIKILDIFSGSGCVGIAILKNTQNREEFTKSFFKNIFVDFAELNPKFIKQIEKNIKINLEKKQDFAPQNPAPHKVYQSDIFKNLPTEKKYHFILANPPYIPKSKKLDRSVLNFEDHNSLFAEENGLYFVKKVILEGLPRLEKNGKIIIEFDETSKNEIEEFLKKEKIKNYLFKKDQFDNWRTLEVWN